MNVENVMKMFLILPFGFPLEYILIECKNKDIFYKLTTNNDT